MAQSWHRVNVGRGNNSVRNSVKEEAWNEVLSTVILGTEDE